MGSNVFGIPITTSYLIEMKTRHSDLITRHDRAKVAMQKKNIEGKDVAARNFAKQLNEEFGKGKTNTMCLVYNATGDPVIFFDSKFWDGEICESPCPLVIANGQWGSFLCGPLGEYHSDTSGFFIYKGKNAAGDDVRWMTAFSNTPRYHSIHAEILPVERDNNLMALKKKLLMIDTNCTIDDTEKAAMYTVIGGGSTPLLEAILTLPDVFGDN